MEALEGTCSGLVLNRGFGREQMPTTWDTRVAVMAHLPVSLLITNQPIISISCP